MIKDRLNVKSLSFSPGSWKASLYMHRSHGHQSTDGSTQESARKKGSFSSVALNLAAVCIMTIKSRCKCQRRSRKPYSCKCGYHVNQEDYDLYNYECSKVCNKIGGWFSSEHGSWSSHWHGRVAINWSFSVLLSLAVFSIFYCLAGSLFTSAGMLDWAQSHTHKGA